MSHPSDTLSAPGWKSRITPRSGSVGPPLGRWARRMRQKMPRHKTALSRVLVTLSTIVVGLVLLLPSTGKAESDFSRGRYGYGASWGHPVVDCGGRRRTRPGHSRYGGRAARDQRPRFERDRPGPEPGSARRRAVGVPGLKVRGRATSGRRPTRSSTLGSSCDVLFATQTTRGSSTADRPVEVRPSADGVNARHVVTASRPTSEPPSLSW